MQFTCRVSRCKQKAAKVTQGTAARLASAFTSIRYRKISHFGEVISASNFKAKNAKIE